MKSRCRYCNDVCPDGSTMCDSCCFIEQEDGNLFDPGEEEDEETLV